MKITVLPIKRFALIQSDVFIDVIQKYGIKKKKDGADKCKIYRQYYMRRTLDYSLRGYYLQRY
jgi:hypothetical protein